MNIVHIEDKAFMGMLIAAVEAFPSKFNGGRKPKGASPEGEVHGLLFGQRIYKDGAAVHNVTFAVSNQIVLERTDGSVSVSDVHIGRIREVTELFPTYSLLGFFHSHPYPKTEFHEKRSVDPSDTDMETAGRIALAHEEDILDMIIGITRQQRRSTIVPTYPDLNMIHACCGNYKYTLSCNLASWSKEEASYRYGSVNNLLCPTAAGLLHTDLA